MTIANPVPLSSTDPTRYDRVSIAFHWVTAGLVIVLFATTLVWNNTPRDLGWRRPLEGLHVSLGICLAVVILGRLLWRAFAGRKLPGVGSTGMRFLARAVHTILYILLALQVGLGYALRWYQGEEFSFFGLFSVPQLLTPDRGMAEQLERLHNINGWAIIYVAAFHAAAALYHRYIMKDGVLHRMVPVSR